jgi:signal peptidase I
MPNEKASERKTVEQPNKRRVGRCLTQLRQWVTVLSLLFCFRSAIADWYDVPTGSMEPTILPGDRICANKLAYGLRVPFTYTWIARWGNPSPGEIVIVHSPKDDVRLVKRLIAGPGDIVEMRNNRLVVNGAALPYGELSAGVLEYFTEREGRAFAEETLNGRGHAVMATRGIPAPRTFGAIKIPADKYFVMGDNRDQSGDSRIFGLVSREKIVGRSSAVAISLDPKRWYLPRWGRFFSAMQ